jgi:hypothetical protein
MQIFTYPDFLSYLEAHGVGEWGPSPYPHHQGLLNKRTYYLPREAHGQICLCQRFDKLIGFTECLLRPTDTLMLGAYGLVPVFAAYLRSLGVTPIATSAYLLTDAEMQPCRDLLTIAILGGWDVYALSPITKTIAYFSHDEYIDVFTLSPVELKEISERLEKFGLRRMSAEAL